MNLRDNLPVWKALLAFQRVGIIVTAIGVTGIVAGTCIMRAFNVNFFGFEEILVMAAFWMYMLGCAHGSFEKSHITANLLEVMMKAGRAKRSLAFVKDVVTTVLCAAMFLWAIQFFVESTGSGPRMPLTPVYRIPMAIGYASMVIGLGFSLFYFVCYTFDSLGRLLRGEDGK